ncbi:hypothetical protein B0T09DRAFT_57243 [Sordaria sp. MPI-SDFR-AT-0083]|nr:hypothetical protein B0T09DRAFT_57243 [Sordaria sp. MPI-SDFR-AT-0083]
MIELGVLTLMVGSGSSIYSPDYLAAAVTGRRGSQQFFVGASLPLKMEVHPNPKTATRSSSQVHCTPKPNIHALTSRCLHDNSVRTGYQAIPTEIEPRTVTVAGQG